PARAAAALLAAARDLGASVRLRTEVVAVHRDSTGRVVGVGTPAGRADARHVVNAAGAWAGQVAALAGADVPVAPRRGVILVTEPVGLLVRHKFYSSDYLYNVSSDDAVLQALPVVQRL